MNAFDLISNSIDRFLADPAQGAVAISRVEELQPEVRADFEKVLADARISYRDGVLIQLAYGVVQPDLDLKSRAPGARSVAQQLGVFLADRHIRHVKDAYQNIGKNSDNLARGNFAAFDSILEWATQTSVEERRLALEIACAVVARTARPVQPMPALNRSSLTFAHVTSFLSELISTPSGGAFQQFSVAALLHTLVEGQGAGSRVETKNLNASDRSSYAAGDIQIVSGSRVIEALEVTANAWSSKIAGVRKTIRDNDLSRLHVIATCAPSEREAAIAALTDLDEDVSVLDVREVIDVLVAILTRAQRAEALTRFYEYLDRYQPNVDLVNHYVAQLNEANLVERIGNRAADDLG